MTPAARVQAAIEVLDTVLSGTPGEKALTNWARRSRFAGSKDRAALRDHVFQALRCRRSYAALGGALTGRGLMVGALRDAGQAPEDIFTGDGYAPAALTDAERSAGMPTQSDLWDLPDWLIDAFTASLGDQARPTAQALRQRAPVMLRAHPGHGTRDQAIAALTADGITARPAPIADTALIVEEGARRVANSAAYLSGAVELQDGSSQAAIEALDLPVGGKVLDYCAGGGGKTLAMAARTEAQWFAHDALPQRMRDLAARADRAGVTVTQLTGDALAAHGPYDLVLCDAPCSGSGTWRRAPEAKWALTPERLSELEEIQADILAAAAPLVAPNGVLAYSTCSVLTEENDAQAERFLRDRPDWACAAQYHWPVQAEGDGFYLAIFQRRTPL